MIDRRTRDATRIIYYVVRKKSCVPFVVLLASLVPGIAAAYSTGIVGYSGKQGAICTDCHSGGDKPDVTLTGPAALAPGAAGVYLLTVHATVSRQPDAGFNVAAGAGSLTPNEANEQIIPGSGELTHRQPKQVNADRNATWSFKWTAPAAPGRYTLYAAANSVNNNGTTSGDNARATTLTITVGDAPVPTATPTATAPPAATPTRTPPPTATPTETPPAAASGDANCDGGVSAADVSAVLVAFDGPPGVCAGVDVNGDGVVDAGDLGAVVDLLF